jgi:hypothetical protein
MKKSILLITCILLAFIFAACSNLKRNNPYDPAGTAFKGVTYKGDISYPDGTTITAMIYDSQGLCLAGYNPTHGYCVIKMEGALTDYVGSTGNAPGQFMNIQDICADDIGNIYAVDNKNIVQIITPSDVTPSSSWTLTNVTTPVDKLFIAYLNNSIYVTSNTDKEIFKYNSTTGIFIDSAMLSFTAYGPFTPGRVFKSANYIFVVNSSSKNQIVKLDVNLAQIGLYDMQDNIFDATLNGGLPELIAAGAVYNVDENMVISLKWGNFGVGPGMVFNGGLIASDQTTGDTYILDGQTIKRFGE